MTCETPGCLQERWMRGNKRMPFCKAHSSIDLTVNPGVEQSRVDDLRAMYLAGSLIIHLDDIRSRTQ